MKKIKALTLIETLLVIVVVALILMVAANQFQRYQQARNIQQAKTAVDMLSNYGSQLYLSNCANMVSKSLSELICPTDAADNMLSSQNAVYCNNSFNIVNPFVHQGINYTIVVDTYTGVPLITIGLPMSSSSLGKIQGKSVEQIVESPLFQKYVAALQPTVVVFKNQKNFYFPAFGLQSQPNPNTETDVICTVASLQDLCFIWHISPANWGTMATDAVANQNLNNQLNAFATQYVPTSSEWQTIQSDNKSATLNCPAINAQTIQKINNP